MCYNHGDTFGTTAFTSYGLFWLTLVGLIVMPKMGLPASPWKNFMGLLPRSLGYFHWFHVHWFSLLPSCKTSSIQFTDYPYLLY